MDDSTLTYLLARLHTVPLPAIPGSFRQDVWREIRHRPSLDAESWWAWFFEPLLRPSMVVSALALAMIFGSSLSLASIDSRAAQTRHALGLEVFSSTSPSLPATLLSRAR